MSDDPQIATERTPPEPDRPKQQRPKMTLAEQSIFLSGLLRRCEMHTGDMKGYFAGEAALMLTTADMLKLETVQQTMALFDLHRADVLVKAEMSKKWRSR